MKNILVKIIFIILIFLNFIYVKNYSFATEDTKTEQQQEKSAFSIDGFIGDAKKFVNDGKEQGETAIDQTGMKSISSVIYNTLFAIGMIVAVAVGIFLGIKIMIASTEEQAKYKELLVPYFVGCIIIFGAFGIWKLVVNMLQNTLG